MKKYESYKKVELPWLNEIPNHWGVEKLKMFSDFGVGNSISHNKKDDYKDNIDANSYISTSDISLQNQKINYSNGMYIKQSDLNFKVVPVGATLVCIEGGSGGKKKAITDREVCIGNKLCYIKIFNHDDKYIYFMILSQYFNDNYGMSITGDRNGVSIGKLCEFKFPIPPLEEQKKIADYLDWKINEIDKLIEINKEKIRKNVLLKQALISEVVTGQFCVLDGFAKKYKEYKKVEVPWLNEIPSHWKLSKVNLVFVERREKVSDKDYFPLSVTKNGIFRQLDNVAKTNDGDNRKKVQINDFVINSRSDRKGSSGLSEFDGSVSLINTVLKIKKKITLSIYIIY